MPVNLFNARRRILAIRIGFALVCCTLLAAAALVPWLAVRHSRAVFSYAYSKPESPTPGPAPAIPTPPAPLTGELQIRSDPEGCAVYLDEVYIGRSPLKISNLQFGPHQIELKRFPFAAARRTIDFKRRTQEVSIELRERTGQIQLVGPAGTAISVDGELLGALPLKPIELPIGPHRFDGQGPINWVKTIEVVEDQRLSFNLETSRSFQAGEPEPVLPAAKQDGSTASLLISTRPWAEITFDDNEVGFAPLLLSGISPGVHTLEVSRRGYRRERRLVNLRPGERGSINIRLEKD